MNNQSDLSLHFIFVTWHAVIVFPTTDETHCRFATEARTQIDPQEIMADVSRKDTFYNLVFIIFRSRKSLYNSIGAPSSLLPDRSEERASQILHSSTKTIPQLFTRSCSIYSRGTKYDSFSSWGYQKLHASGKGQSSWHPDKNEQKFGTLVAPLQRMLHHFLWLIRVPGSLSGPVWDAGCSIAEK